MKTTQTPKPAYPYVNMVSFGAAVKTGLPILQKPVPVAAVVAAQFREGAGLVWVDIPRPDDGILLAGGAGVPVLDFLRGGWVWLRVQTPEPKPVQLCPTKDFPALLEIRETPPGDHRGHTRYLAVKFNGWLQPAGREGYYLLHTIHLPGLYPQVQGAPDATA